MEILRMGVLGAARITSMALLRPAQELAGVEIVAVAARDSERAARFAHRNGIARTFASYEDLIHASDIDAVYVPLPNSLHLKWAIAALNAGKHVLCEKPLGANADEAGVITEASERANRVLMEAFHFRHHPLAKRVEAIVRSGEIGPVRHVIAHMCIPIVERSNIRFRFDLAGGAAMDVGCYVVNFARMVAGAEPEVERVRVKLASPQVDRRVEAELRFKGGATALVIGSILSRTLFRMSARVECEQGDIRIWNPFLPQWGHRVVIRGPSGRRVETFRGESTYVHQLRAFVAAVHGEGPILTDGKDAVATMRVIDRIYEVAGLKRRGA
jgi:predicted dehydrogenase